MRGDLFVRLLLAGSLLAMAACANPGWTPPKSSQTHDSRAQQELDSGGAGGGGGY